VLFAAAGESINEIGRSAVNLSSEPVVCGGDIIVFRPTAEMDPVFLGYACNAHPIAHQKSSMGRGFTVVHVYADELKQLVLPVPPLGEQVTIGAVLTEIDHRINRLVASKRRLIGLLEEQKQAIIHRAVTRGLDAHVRLKPSGIEWLGEVPAHWERTQLKRVSKVQTGITLGKDYLDVPTVERPYLRVANVQAGRVKLDSVFSIRIPVTEARATTLHAGDVLMTEGGDIDKLGRGCVWHGEIADCVHQNHVFAVRPDQQRLSPDFLVFVLASAHGRRYFELTAKRTTNLASTNSTTLGAFPMLLPPLEEQAQIVQAVRTDVDATERGIASAEREIDLLREYRTRLITDVVTGKLDVRGVSLPPLPDEPDAPPDPDGAEPVEDPELMDAAEAMAERAAGDALT